MTDSGNYRVKKATALADGTDYLEFVGASYRTQFEDYEHPKSPELTLPG